MSIRPAAHYDQAYFDKWYRHPKHRVKSPLDIRRQLGFVVAATEYILERPVTKVLDVGAGEGNWGQALKALRPRAKYYGVDPSAYAVERFGKARNIRRGGFGDLADLRLPDDFDLVLCCGVMNYVPPAELSTGLRWLTTACVGVAYFEIFTAADDAVGDFSRSAARSPRSWRALLKRTGWTPLGMHLYLRSDMAGIAAALERAV
ncbi:MAG: class I SAM-dependent methyltransferase, partial [Gemmatimonadetes bacterium]|nr:class I SAM-dependent methyltransferase [Gemmatimonadota bacterium]